MTKKFKSISNLIILCLLVISGVVLFLLSGNNISPKPEVNPVPVSPTPSEQPSVFPEKPDDALPIVAIIVDDLGNSRTVNRAIDEIPVSLTLAVLPFRLYTADAVNYFSDSTKFELILHMPMEPIAEKDKEEKMLMTNMSEAKIKELLDEVFLQMGNSIVGMNNHKGSLFTSDEEKMRIVLGELIKRNLYFLDSYTHAQSVGFSLAREMGVKTVRRDVFLDGQDSEEYIKDKLYETVLLAEENGYAVAIGHAKENTIKVLTEETPSLVNRVNFIKISEMVR